jgi:metal-responsive CopG/Arc/MetJ family transcriptional regulator
MLIEKQRLIVEVAPALVERINTYWHERRLPSRTAAVRELIEAGLSQIMRLPGDMPSDEDA